MSNDATIQTALHDFLLWERLELGDDEYAAACEVVDHLEACLNSYGEDALSDTELARLGDERSTAFCCRFGPERIIATLPFFLDYYMVRNVVTSENVLAAAGTTIALLATWLQDNGYADADLSRRVRKHGATAAIDLPRAERMATLLTALAATSAPGRGVETTDGFLAVTRIEDGALWFDGIGPVDVAREVAELARVGWMVSIVLACVDDRWTVCEVGNVYPRSAPGLDC